MNKAEIDFRNAGYRELFKNNVGRAPGSSPYTLLSYFPDDFLLFVDESHVTLPQAGECLRVTCKKKEP